MLLLAPYNKNDNDSSSSSDILENYAGRTMVRTIPFLHTLCQYNHIKKINIYSNSNVLMRCIAAIFTDNVKMVSLRPDNTEKLTNPILFALHSKSYLT